MDCVIPAVLDEKNKVFHPHQELHLKGNFEFINAHAQWGVQEYVV